MIHFTMRPAEKSELPAAVDLYQECWKDERLVHVPNWSANDERTERLFRAANFKRYGVHIINVNQQDVGLASIHQTQTEIHFRDLCLLPDYRSLGIGSHLIAIVKEQAILCNVPFKLQTEKHNVRAQELYRASGFVQTAETPWNITMHWWPEKIRPA